MIKRSKEKEYEEWLMSQIKLHGLCLKPEAINGGAMALDISPVTTARYLNKITSEQGEFRVVRGFNARQSYVATKDFPFSSNREMEQQGLAFEQGCEMQKSIAYRK